MSPRACARGGCCALAIELTSQGKPGVFCSRRCCLLASHARRMIRLRAERPASAPSFCRCGAPIAQPRRGRRVWCSEGCRDRHRAVKPSGPCKRPGCTHQRAPRRWAYCSEECSKIATAAKRAA